MNEMTNMSAVNPTAVAAVTNAAPEFNWFSFILGALLLGVILGVVWYIKDQRKKPGNEKSKPEKKKFKVWAWNSVVGKLQEKQKVEDVFGVGNLLTWIRDYQAASKKPVQFYVIRPTDENLAKMKYRADERMDPDHSLLVIVTPVGKSKFLDMKLFTFDVMQDKLEQRLNQAGGVLLLN